MASPRHGASPLRDRLLSNSPDPMKKQGWSDQPVPGSPNVSPLRISKRDSPVRQPDAQVARRTSSSFKHVRNNNLVSKSPFKSQIPTAATPVPAVPRPFPSPARRVSGEKRQRPQSIHDQAEAENDRPFAYKRERRQSKTFQGLIQKEPVTKSPFRQHQDPVPPTPSRIPVPAIPSPARSSLVSKRMHGPRLSGRRERRKTVTFDERCDVVEFDRDEEDGSLSSDPEDEDGSDPFFAPQPPPQADDSSYESIELSDNDANTSHLPDTPMPLGLDLDPDVSITGLVDAMFAPAAGTSTPPPIPGLGSVHTRNFTPELDRMTDLDTEDGVPFGRSHHATRTAAFHAQAQRHPPPVPAPQLCGGGGRPLPRPDNSDMTPPRAGTLGMHSPPLGRTTHLERWRATVDEVEEEDVARLPGSPSPAPALHNHVHAEMGLPRFSLPSVGGNGEEGEDPFVLPRLRDEPLPQGGEDSRDVSMGHVHGEMQLDPPLEKQASSRETHSQQSQNQGQPGSGGRPRISREEVQRRLMRTRSASPEAAGGEQEQAEQQRRREDPMEEDGEEYDTAEESREEFKEESREETEHERDEDEFREEHEEEARYDAERERERERDVEMTLNREREMEEREGSASTEIGVVETAEKRDVLQALVSGSPSASSPRIEPSFTPTAPTHDDGAEEFGLRAPGLGLDFGSRFGLGGLGIALGGNGSVNSRMSGGEGLRTAARRDPPERMPVDMDMRSALDRLMDDVAGAGGAAGANGEGEGDDSVRTEDAEPVYVPVQHTHPVARAATDSALLQMGDSAGLSRSVSVASSSSLLSLPPPPVPPKDNIRSREAMIIEKRREMRRFDDEGYDYVPPMAESNTHLRVGRPSARRSMSTGDAEELSRLRGKGLLDVGAGKDDLLGDSIEKELNKLEAPHKRKYHVRQHEGMIYASSSDSERISHMAGAGDVDAGKAWKTVRRPSDMNEYSKQIKEYRAQQNPGKAYGKVFVKVLGVKGMHLPLPTQPTAVTCTLNNGIHFVTTPECVLARDCRIDQEFELIEHSKLEFTLTLKIRRDPHIISQFKAVAPAPVQAPAPRPPPVVQQTSSKGGKRSFWSSSPKKSKDKEKAAPAPAPPVPAPVQAPQRLPENLARYLKPDGTLARAFISFKDLAVRCDTRLFETNYPLIGQRVELGGKASTLQVGELVLQMFRLPPLPGIPPDELPQSLEECHRGLRHINWHKVTYFQGTLTQNGGDCSTWRRRQLRVIGANLVAFNDVTKKATATIDLKKAVTVEDDQEARGATSPASATTARSSRYDEYDGLYGVERSFRLIFPNEQEIVFFADTDEEKAKWLEVLRALVGHIPPHPLWAELLWQRQEELSKRASQRGP
ncbi:hypothetical protein DFH07DRAFT_781904 [Mycena maculata]|uniref:PH domain-containing protein n=1 Tax=Mycena maculata TaxID=230809 RepID=A0AAD7HW63_9AGAR|nr:hypothetical protein DFH07DRAFT_781904 [Mycena maculata]